MNGGPTRTVLVVDDDLALLALLERGLPVHLASYRVAAAVHGADAVAYLRSDAVDVLVTDVTMPVMDGFELLAYVRRHHPNLPVVVLSTMAPDGIREALPAGGIPRIVRKPSSLAAIAKAVTEARAETLRGRMTGVELAPLLRLLQIERKSCSLLVRSGTSKGRLHFRSGALIDAYSFELDTDGDAAARHLLGLEGVTVDFERSLRDHRNLIEMPLEALLLDAARQRDEARQRERTGTGEPQKPRDETAAEPGAGVHAAVPGALPVDAALARLELALRDLRARQVSTTGVLESTAPWFERAAATLEATAGGAWGVGGDEAGVARAWREVAATAERLLRAAEALAGVPGERRA